MTQTRMSEHVLSATLLKRRQGPGRYEPLIAFTTVKPLSRKATALGALALVIVSLRTGVAVKRVELGMGSAAAVFATYHVLAVVSGILVE